MDMHLDGSHADAIAQNDPERGFTRGRKNPLRMTG
jgi:hypothetical protein